MNIKELYVKNKEIVDINGSSHYINWNKQSNDQNSDISKSFDYLKNIKSNTTHNPTRELELKTIAWHIVTQLCHRDSTNWTQPTITDQYPKVFYRSQQLSDHFKTSMIDEELRMLIIKTAKDKMVSELQSFIVNPKQSTPETSSAMIYDMMPILKREYLEDLIAVQDIMDKPAFKEIKKEFDMAGNKGYVVNEFKYVATLYQRKKDIQHKYHEEENFEPSFKKVSQNANRISYYLEILPVMDEIARRVDNLKTLNEKGFKERLSSEEQQLFKELKPKTTLYCNNKENILKSVKFDAKHFAIMETIHDALKTNYMRPLEMIDFQDQMTQNMNKYQYKNYRDFKHLFVELKHMDLELKYNPNAYKTEQQIAEESSKGILSFILKKIKGDKPIVDAVDKQSNTNKKFKM